MLEITQEDREFNPQADWFDLFCPIAQPMKFRLTYDGPLKSNGDPAQKQFIRRAFHGQFVELWNSNELLKYIQIGKSKNPHLNLSTIADSHSIGNFRFVPLVTRALRLVCGLDILFLRRENAGSLILQGGDIDNRIKTLFDALRMPQEPNDLPPGDKPEDDEDPFFCLLENDSLITECNIVTDRLLQLPKEKQRQTDVRLIINVTVIQTVVTIENLGF